MLATMRMRLGTTWGNDLEIELTTELDNAHALSTAELALLQALTMQKYCEVIRDENERVIENGAPSAEARDEMRRAAESRASVGDREASRLEEMQRDREDPRDARRGEQARSG